MIRLAWILFYLAEATVTDTYRWGATQKTIRAESTDTQLNTTEHQFLKLEIIDTEGGDIVCINRDIYPTVTFTCDADFRRVVVMAVKDAKDTDSWLAPIPSRCSDRRRYRYDIDSVHNGQIAIPRTTESMVDSIELPDTTLTSGYAVGSLSTEWSPLKSERNDLLVLARIESGRVKQIVGLFTNDNFIHVAPLFDVEVNWVAVEDDFVENILVYAYTHHDDNDMSVVLGHTESLSDPDWKYWQCGAGCEEAAFENWVKVFSLTGYVVMDNDQAYMVSDDQVSETSLSNSTQISTQTVESLTNGLRHYPSEIVRNRTKRFIVEWDTTADEFLIHNYVKNETTVNHTISLSDFCPEIASTSTIVKSTVADAFAFVDDEKTCMIQAYSRKGDESTGPYDVSMMGKVLEHPGISTKLVDIDAHLRLTLLTFNSVSGLLETYRTSFNDLLHDSGPSLQPRISTTVTGYEKGYKLAHYDVSEDSVNIVFYYNDAGTIKLTNEMTFVADVTNNVDCIHLNLLSTGEERKEIQLENGSLSFEWVPFNVEYYHEFSPKPPKKVHPNGTLDIDDQFEDEDFVTYATLVNSKIEDYTAANTNLQRSSPSNVFLSNNERLVIEARIQGNTGQEDAIASAELLYSLHEELVGTTLIETTDAISHRGTERTIQLKIRPKTLKKAESGMITSESVVTLKVTSPNVCIEQFQVETNAQNLAPSEAVSRVSIGCPPNRNLTFNKQATKDFQMENEEQMTNDLNCFSDPDELQRSDDRTFNKLPMCVKFESEGFKPNLTINNLFMNSSIPFNDNYTIQVMNGDWLRYQDDEYLIPNFDDKEKCREANKLPRSDPRSPPKWTKYNCLGPYFPESENNTNNFIRKRNQQAKGPVDGGSQKQSGLANLYAIWDSADLWKPVDSDNVQFSEAFKMFNSLSNSSIEWVCKHKSPCGRRPNENGRLWPPLAFDGLRTMFYGFSNMFKEEPYTTYQDFHPPEYFLHIRVTNDLEKVFEQFDVPEQDLQNNCLLETFFTLRVGYVKLDAYTNLMITIISFCILMAGFGVYVTLQQHELAVEKCKDQVYDFFDGSGNAERALYDAEYERKMTLINDKQLRRGESSYSQSSNMRQTSILNTYGRQTSAHEMAKRISLNQSPYNKRTSQVQPQQQQPGAYVLGQHNTAVQRRLSAVQGAAKDDIYKRGSITIKKS